MTTRRFAGVTKIDLTAKLLGQDVQRHKKAGSLCNVERNNGNPGEFLVWFSGRFYIKVDAINLHDTIFFTDGSP